MAEAIDRFLENYTIYTILGMYFASCALFYALGSLWAYIENRRYYRKARY